MAGGGRVYAGGCGDSNLTLLFQNPRAPSHSDALFLSGSSTSFLGSSSMVSFEDARGGKRSNGSFFCPYDQEENIDDDFDEYFSQPGKKRRLTADQVHFLERNFEVENKLEPDRKIQLAKDLGLQPRQVAIWFQNRRARWKTKQLEKDYDALQAAFNSLKTNYDSLLKEKENLRAEVILLKDKLQLKEEDRENPQLSDANRACQAPSQDPISESISEGEESRVYVVDARQEVLSSAKSDVFDSESPHYTEGGRSSLLENADSSYVFEQDYSDLSQDEEDDFSKSLVPSMYVFPKLEDVNCSDPPANSSNTGFPVEDHAIWSWCF